MAPRVWLAVVAMLGLVAFGYAAARSRSGGSAALRSEQSQPGVTVPNGLVAVTSSGKLFHDPACKFIHGPIEMIPATEAVSEGYTPCVRCMREVLGR